MLKEILNGNALLYAMLALCAVGVLSKLAVWISYRRLTKATENMASSKNALTTQLKLKFENCYKLNLNVQNVPAFVDKYLQKYKVLGIRVHTADRIPKAAMLLTVLVGTAACAGAFWQELGARRIILYGAVGILSVLALGLVDFILDTADKKAMAVTNLQDYLDNILTNRLSHEYEDEASKEIVEGKQAAELLKQGKTQAAATNLKLKKPKNPKKPKGDSINEEEVIREILREFLT